MIAIVDYGAGNLKSVANALRAQAVPHEVVQDAARLRQAGKIILPGVGHFGQMMRALDSLHVRKVLLDRIRSGVPFLGICLGLQALFENSEEAPEVVGLGLFPGSIKRFTGDIRVPHMGWNAIEFRGEARQQGHVSHRPPSSLFQGLPANPYFYFANSYYAPLVPSTSALCGYGDVRFTAAIECENVFAVQFHPEKSGSSGQQLLRNFVEL